MVVVQNTRYVSISQVHQQCSILFVETGMSFYVSSPYQTTKLSLLHSFMLMLFRARLMMLLLGTPSTKRKQGREQEEEGEEENISWANRLFSLTSLNVTLEYVGV